MRINLQTLLFLLLAVTATMGGFKKKTRAKDNRYCTSTICHTENIACHNNGSLHDCHHSAKYVEMKKYKKDLDSMFNTVRSKVARGGYRNLPVAGRMARMEWSEELAWFAKLQISRCRLRNAFCMNSPYFYYIGSMADELIRPSGNIQTSELAIMKAMVEDWFSQLPGIPRSDTLRLPSSYKRASTYRSTLLINEKNSNFGCAALTFQYTGYRYFLFSCAFATINIPEQPIYKWSTRPGRDCYMPDKQYPNLCDRRERYGNDLPLRNLSAYIEPIYT
ncbi:allergen Tab y 5.0101-like [Drosophila miranda]|uniref:allergen Tab y 5.0101-like n=1 Tax=Drosophila miranda TaxID=7229 RepID=UPI0007E82ED4|nr:allergen Tab y 5.0101-like [Drosophila miranda]